MDNFIILLVIFHFIIFFAFSKGYSSSDSEVVYKWKKVEYENLPQPENSWVGPYRYYDPQNCDLLGMAYHPASGLMLVAVGRLRPGTPSTVAAFCVSDYRKGSSPKFWAFPDYQTNALRASDFDVPEDEGRKYSKKKPNKYNHGINYYDWNQHYTGGSHHYLYQKPLYQKPQSILPLTSSTNDLRIISAYSVNVDEECNRAFFVDVGVLHYYAYRDNNTNVIQRPAVLFYDLTSDGCETRNFQLIRRSEIPDRVASDMSLGLLYMTIDRQSDSCDDVMFYITNIFTNHIIVYDYKRNDFWSFTNHETFQPVTAESYLMFDKTYHYQLVMGVISFALGYPDRNGDRTAYYIAGASTAQFSVSTSVLKNKRKSPRNYNPDDFSIMGYRGCDSQTARMVVDYNYGVVFYAELQSNRITCWNMNKPLNPDNIGVVYESEKLLYPLQIFIDSAGYLWFNTCQVPIVFTSDMPININKVNFRFFKIKISDAIRGTVCEDY